MTKAELMEAMKDAPDDAEITAVIGGVATSDIIEAKKVFVNYIEGDKEDGWGVWLTLKSAPSEIKETLDKYQKHELEILKGRYADGARSLAKLDKVEASIHVVEADRLARFYSNGENGARYLAELKNVREKKRKELDDIFDLIVKTARGEI